MSWIDDVINKLSGGRFSIAGLMNVSQGSIITEKDKFVTSKGVTKVIQIVQMPYIYTKELQTEIAMKISNKAPDVKITTYAEINRCTIPISHPTFITQMNRALQDYVKIDSMFNGLDKIHQRSGVVRNNGFRTQRFGKQDLERAQQRSDSYTEVQNNINARGAVYYQVKYFIHLTFPNTKSAESNYESIFAMVNSEVNKAEKMTKKIGTYLLNMSPSVTDIQNIPSAKILTSNEGLANMLPYRSQGLIATKGILAGTDVRKKSPIYIDAYGTDEGSTILINGEAGSGKTVVAYHLGLQAMGVDTTVVYLDLKGGTVSKALGELMDNYEVINFFGTNAKFINTMHLSQANREYTVEDAIRNTVALLMLMVSLQPNEGSAQDLESLLRSAVSGYYNQLKIKDGNPSSYRNSLTMTYGELLNHLGENLQQAGRQDETHLYSIASRRISATLKEFHMERNDNAIDIASLYDRDAIVFDFDKDKEINVARIDAIRIFFVMFFTKQLGRYNKRYGRYTMLVGDEGNQYLNIEGLDVEISDLTARARSSNTSVVFVTNDLSVVHHPRMSGFRSNIAVYMVGRVNDSDTDLIKTLNQNRRFAKDINTINTYPGKYSRAFAVSSRLGGYSDNTILRVELPPHVVKAFQSKTVQTE